MIRMSMGGTRIKDYPLPGTPTIRPTLPAIQQLIDDDAPGI
jgi:hypothetical protein